MKCFREAGFPTGNLDANDVTLDDDQDDDIPLIQLKLKIQSQKKRNMTETGKNNVGKY